MDSIYNLLSNAYGKNHYEIDKPLQVILEYFLDKVPNLLDLGEFVGKDLYELADYVDKVSKPKHIMWSINGERIDKIWLNPVHIEVVERLIVNYGINKPHYRGEPWHRHYAMGYLVSDPGIYCIITVTNQTAYAIYKYGSERLKKYIPHLIGEMRPVLYGATWFTEIQGGSDLGANITVAKKDRDIWRITGEKYFASNVGFANIALVTARPEGAPLGAKGLALFLVPEFNSKGERNFKVRRLKEKSGTISVPTGEVEFQDSEAYLIGEERKGIYYTMEDLMISRLSNAVGAMGIARKAFLEAYYYSQVRKAFNKLLIDHPLVKRDLLEMELLLEGALIVAFKAIDQFDKSWHTIPPYNEDYHYARLLTHIAKNITAEAAAYITKLSMELHGGIGFLEEFPIERLHREALITPIWEGTSNIQALDMLEAMAKKRAHIPLLRDMESILEEIHEGRSVAQLAFSTIKETLVQLANYNEIEAQFYAKEILMTLGHSIAVMLLAHVGNKLGLSRFITLANLYSTRYLKRRDFDREIISKLRDLILIEELPEVKIPV